MVFLCRCFSCSFQIEEEEEIEYEPRSQPQSTSNSTPTQTFYTASSNFNPSVTDSQIKASLFSNDLKDFTFSELKAATNNFSLSAKIGEGGFGSVYTGVITNPLDSTKTLNVAVKMLGTTGLQGHKEWVTEVNVLGMVKHPNLVKLVGYCAKENEKGILRLLVYELMCNGSVDRHLFTISKSKSPLSWSTRLKVAQDAASGLAYLHEYMDFQIIFRDLNSSNILLDDQWNAKLSDFGLARLGPEQGFTHVSTRVIGTMGYMAPEYLKTGHLTPMCDVWSYGVLLYELITGRPSLDTRRPKNEQKLLEWVKPYIGSERFELIIDPRLEGNYSLESAQKLSFIANRCLSIDPKSRPKMSEALEMVNQLITGVAIEPKMGFKKTPEKMKNESERGSSEGQRKESACFSRICCVS